MFKLKKKIVANNFMKFIAPHRNSSLLATPLGFLFFASQLFLAKSLGFTDMKIINEEIIYERLSKQRRFSHYHFVSVGWMGGNK
jgi:hypothetical protein